MNPRIQRLAEALAEDGRDVYLAQTAVSMDYLHGFAENAHERFLVLAIDTQARVRLICPALSANQARRCGIEDIRTWVDGEDPLVHFRQLAEDWNLKSAIFAVDDHLPAKMLLEMQDALPAALFKPGQPTLSRLRRHKDATELETLKQAARIADDAWLEVKPQLRAGMTEKQAAKLLSTAMESRGGNVTFTIVAAGPNGAEPHHLTDDTVMNEGDVVILDFGCEFGGYQSDITRTIALGQAPDRAKEDYRRVFTAHHASRAAARPGVTAGSVDAAGRKVLEDAGIAEFFVHRTGHGLGMEGHEEPNITPGSDEVLQTGDVFSIEPGVYRAGEWGIRIENIVYLDAAACVSFNDEPSSELEIL